MARCEVKPSQHRTPAGAVLPGVDSFRADPLFPKIERAVAPSNLPPTMGLPMSTEGA